MTPKKFIASLLIGAQLSIAVPAFADPVVLPQPPVPIPGEVDVGAALSPMKKGQIAPFTGVLLSPKATATIVAQLNSLQEQINIEVEHARAEERARCDFRVSEQETTCTADKKVLQAQVESRDKQLQILNEQLKKEQESRPNTTLWVGLGVGGGFLLGVALSALSVYAVNQSSK